MANGDVIYAINRGNRDLVWKWNSQRYMLRANETAIVPWEAMCLYMGRPDAVDYDDRRRDRFDEWQRLRMKYGAYDSAERWEANKPYVECMTLDEKKIITVVDDPEGDALTPDNTTKMQNAMLQTRLRQLEAEMRSLRRATNVAQMQDDAEASGVQVTEDRDPDREFEQDEMIGDHQTVPGPRVEFPRAVVEDAPVHTPGPSEE